MSTFGLPSVIFCDWRIVEENISICRLLRIWSLLSSFYNTIYLLRISIISRMIFHHTRPRPCPIGPLQHGRPRPPPRHTPTFQGRCPDVHLPRQQSHPTDLPRTYRSRRLQQGCDASVTIARSRWSLVFHPENLKPLASVLDRNSTTTQTRRNTTPKGKRKLQIAVSCMKSILRLSLFLGSHKIFTSS
jgi:hypothetical protein